MLSYLFLISVLPVSFATDLRYKVMLSIFVSVSELSFQVCGKDPKLTCYAMVLGIVSAALIVSTYNVFLISHPHKTLNSSVHAGYVRKLAL